MSRCEYNISCHISTKHANNANNRSMQEQGRQLVCRISKTFLADKVPSKNQAQSCLLAFKLANTSKGSFSKSASRDVEQIRKKISLSRRTVTHCVELADEDLASELNQKAELYSLALDESRDTAQLWILNNGNND